MSPSVSASARTTCLARNPRLVYGRMTGWGRSGPLADRAGHDINYLAVAGALGAFGRAGEPPVPPLSIIADLGAGGLLLAYGITCALFERATSGTGQVVDAAMLDGTALFMGPWLEAQQAGTWNDARGTNNLDSGAPYYDSYRCADGEYVAVGALEPQFYARLLEGLDLDAASIPDRQDPANWPALRALFAERFSTLTRDEWADHFAGVDACVAPVLKLAEVPRASADRRRRDDRLRRRHRCIPRRHRASTAHRERSPVAPASLAPTPTRSSPISATTSRPWPHCGHGASWPEAAVLSAR